MVENCISAALKVSKSGFSYQTVEIIEYVKSKVTESAVIDYFDFKRLVKGSPEARSFFSHFSIPLLAEEHTSKTQNYFKVTAEAYNHFKYTGELQESDKIGFKVPANLVQKKRFIKFKNWCHNQLTLLSQGKEEVNSHFTVFPSHVFGINLTSLKKPLQYVRSSKKDTEMLVYSVGKIVVLFYPSMGQQKYYLYHEFEVSAVTQAKQNTEMFASAEIALKPAIHIWSSEAMQPLLTIKGQHEYAVQLLEFSMDDKFVVSLGTRQYSPLLVYSTLSGELVFSFQLYSIAQDLSQLYLGDIRKEANKVYLGRAIDRPDSEKNSVFIVSTAEDCCLLYKQGSSFRLVEVFCEEEELDKIVCVSYLKALSVEETETVRFVTGHTNGTLSLWDETGFLRVLKTFSKTVVNIKETYKGYAVMAEKISIVPY